MFTAFLHEMRRFIVVLRHGGRHHILYFMTIRYFLYNLNRFFPKKPNLWLVNTGRGQRYADNPRYLFEHVLKDHSEIQIFWITKSKNLYHQLLNAKKPVAYAYSLRGTWLLLRAKAYVFSGELKALAWFGAGRKTFCMQLWHGSPLKKINCDDLTQWQDFTNEGYKHHLYLHPYDAEHYDAVASPSLYFKKIYQSAFRLQCRHFPLLGYPRIDSLLLHARPYQAQAPKILYAPTFRGRHGVKHALNDCATPQSRQLAALNQLFLQYHANMEVQFHPNDSASSQILGFECIRPVAKYEDFYTYLATMDILITDYSSLIYDFLVTKKPVICVTTDLEQYVSEDRQIYRHPAEIPGVYVCNSWDAAYATLENIFKRGPDSEKIPADEILKKEIYAFQDCNAAKRTVKYLKRVSRMHRFKR